MENHVIRYGELCFILDRLSSESLQNIENSLENRINEAVIALNGLREFRDERKTT